jgi:hypothetical protein
VKTKGNETEVSANLVKLVQQPFLRVFAMKTEKADKHNCLSALVLSNEAEGARTLNLRIDSPML